jgi:CheY-like chemotaxis protein
MMGGKDKIDDLQGKPLRILVVDDQEDVAESIGRLLRVYGHEVRTVFDSCIALRIFSQFRPNFVLLDIGMPGMDGHDLCKAIRALPEGQQIPIIAITGFADDAVREKSYQVGFDRHIVKPVKVETLCDLLAEFSEKSVVNATTN